MRIRELRLKGFKRFENLHISGIGEEVRLVVLIGPNGSGKSSIFDAFRVWHGLNGGNHIGMSSDYHLKKGCVFEGNPPENVVVAYHKGFPHDSDRKKQFYIRSSYRISSDFELSELRKASSLPEAPMVNRLIDPDSLVEDNYKRIVSSAIGDLFNSKYDEETVLALREKIIGEVRSSVKALFPDLELKGIGDPMQRGTFLFKKGSSDDFHYKNLSGGEKAAFDIILDIIIKRTFYDNTVYCIDEPDSHMHPELQAGLLSQMIELLPAECQLWIATHSIGMLERAFRIHQDNPGLVAFLDFSDRIFDESVEMTPSKVSSEVRKRLLKISLSDLSNYISPRVVYVCEGGSNRDEGSWNQGFDAKCYKIIFENEFPDVEFISVGNDVDVTKNVEIIKKLMRNMLGDVSVVGLLDRDFRSDQEVDGFRQDGFRVLSRRHIESYLLDDEVIKRLCVSNGHSELVTEILELKKESISNSVNRGNDEDDLKSAAGEITTSLRKRLRLIKCGNTTGAFLRDTMAPLVLQCPTVYQELKKAIFD